MVAAHLWLFGLEGSVGAVMICFGLALELR